MRIRCRIAMVLLGLACAAPVFAGENPDPNARIEALLSPEVLLQGVVRDEDVKLLFDHLRAALLAAYEGREAPPAEELNRRAEAIAAEMKSRGMLAGLLLLAAFETAARQALRESVAAPATAR